VPCPAGSDLHSLVPLTAEKGHRAARPACLPGQRLPALPSVVAAELRRESSPECGRADAFSVDSRRSSRSHVVVHPARPRLHATVGRLVLDLERDALVLDDEEEGWGLQANFREQRSSNKTRKIAFYGLNFQVHLTSSMLYFSGLNFANRPKHDFTFIINFPILAAATIDIGISCRIVIHIVSCNIWET